MPIPTPRSKEKKSEFVARCVSAISNEYKDNKQAVAICYNQFNEAKASADGVVDLGNNDEMLLIKNVKNQSSLASENDMEDESSNENAENSNDKLEDYQEDFFEMSSASISSIAKHAQNIIDALNNPTVKKNLQESWLQGKIAITEDYMLTIHNFVMFGKPE